MVLLFIKGTLAFVSFVRVPDVLFTGPGEYHLNVKEPSDYSVWHQTTASNHGVFTVHGPDLPNGTRITVERSGEVVPTRVYGGATISGTGSGTKHSILIFTALVPGDYLIKVTGFEDSHTFSISQGNGLGSFFSFFGWLMAAGFAGVVAVTFLILALAKKFPKGAVPPVIEG